MEHLGSDSRMGPRFRLSRPNEVGKSKNTKRRKMLSRRCKYLVHATIVSRGRVGTVGSHAGHLCGTVLQRCFGHPRRMTHACCGRSFPSLRRQRNSRGGKRVVGHAQTQVVDEVVQRVRITFCRCSTQHLAEVLEDETGFASHRLANFGAKCYNQLHLLLLCEVLREIHFAPHIQGPVCLPITEELRKYVIDVREVDITLDSLGPLSLFRFL